MRSFRIGILMIVLTCLSVGLAEAEVFEWNGAAKDIEMLHIDIHRGDIEVRPADGGEITISARKRGPKKEVEQVRLEVEETLSGLSILAIYPPRQRRDQPKTKVDIDVEIRLPPGVRFVGKTEVGDVVALGLSDPIEASSTQGDIRLSTSSYAEARTVNGRIEAHLGRADWRGTMSFRTVNGSIEVALPSSSDAEISASSVNGKFQTDLFPVSVNRYGRRGPSTIRGTLGEGGRKLSMESVNGNLRLSRNREK